MSLIGAMAFFALGALVGVETEFEAMGGLLAAAGVAFGGLLLILALVGFVLAYGFWTGKGWAWILGIIFSIIGIIIGLVSIIGNPSSVIGIIINGLILYYLTRPHVKAWFGKA